MLTQPLLDKLTQLRLSAFRAALEEQLHNPQYAELPFEDRLGLLVDRECTHRDNNRLKRYLKAARLPLPATMENLDLLPITAVRDFPPLLPSLRIWPLRIEPSSGVRDLRSLLRSPASSKMQMMASLRMAARPRRAASSKWVISLLVRGSGCQFFLGRRRSAAGLVVRKPCW
jgi:hypothetical protein